jgi:hypothetical protein
MSTSAALDAPRAPFRVPPLRLRMMFAWALALLFGAGAFRLADYMSHALPRVNALEELAYYPSGKHLAPATLGHGDTAADLAWIRAVQYYGEHRHSDNRFAHLAHIFDILTTLAPRFESAYVFGSFSLAQEGRDFAAGERLMQKGLEANPRSGWLAFQMGFMYFVRPGGRDLAHAAEYFERAAHLPGGPPESARFAAYARQNAGDLAMAYQLWARVKATSGNRYMQETADREMDRIQVAIARHRKELAMTRLTTPVVLIKAGER